MKIALTVGHSLLKNGNYTSADGKAYGGCNEYKWCKAFSKQVASALKKNGIIYTSFKYGSYAGIRNGRYFTDFTEDAFADFMADIRDIRLEEQWVSTDIRADRGDEKWLNVILRKS